VNRRCLPSTECKELRRIAINRSPRQFFSSDGVDDWTDLLRSAQVSGEMLSIEITEGLLLDDRHDVLKQLNQMRALGITLSLDDFGTGYSALSYLKKFSIDYLKIDRSFVSALLKTRAIAHCRIDHRYGTPVEYPTDRRRCGDAGASSTAGCGWLRHGARIFLCTANAGAGISRFCRSYRNHATGFVLKDS